MFTMLGTGKAHYSKRRFLVFFDDGSSDAVQSHLSTRFLSILMWIVCERDLVAIPKLLLYHRLKADSDSVENN